MSFFRNMTASIAGSNVPVSFSVRSPAATASAIWTHFRQENKKNGRPFVKKPLSLVLSMGSQRQTVALTGSKDHEEDVIARAIMSMNGPSFDPASLETIKVGDIGEMRA